jgi:phage/plasmid-associated DNA primase
VKSGDLYLSPAILKASEEYRESQNVIGRFLADECELMKDLKAKEVLKLGGVPAFTIPKRALYARFQSWCEEKGELYVKSEKVFSEELKKSQYKLEEAKPSDGMGKQINSWVGIRGLWVGAPSEA